MHKLDTYVAHYTLVIESIIRALKPWPIGKGFVVIEFTAG
jgi:hypothetical protein